jgi:hypothetical protein
VLYCSVADTGSMKVKHMIIFLNVKILNFSIKHKVLLKLIFISHLPM